MGITPDEHGGLSGSTGDRPAEWLQQLPVAALVLSADGRALNWNPAAARLLGTRSGSEPLRITDASVSWLTRLLAEVTARGSGRLRITRDERGVRRVLELRASRFGTDEMLVFLRDRSALLERRRSRRERDSRLVQSLDAMHDAALIEQDGSIVYANEAAARLLSQSRRELTGVPVSRILDVATLRRIERLHAGESVTADLLDVTLRRRNGAPVTVNVTALPTEYRRQAALQLMLHDVTAQRQAEAALRATHERLRLISETIRDHAIVTVDGGGRIASWNVSAQRLTGHGADDMIRAPFALLHTGTDKEVAALFAERSHGGRTEAEAVLRRRDGSTFHAHLTVMPLQHAAEQGEGHAVVIRDLTERRRAEESLRRSEEQLRHSQKMDAIGRLAAGIAHDFNNILTAVQGHVQFLLEDLPVELAAREDAAEIKKAADRATGLTRQLLTFARKQPVEPALLDVNDVVTGLEKLLRRLLRADIELDTAFNDVPSVFADPGQIEQVLVNLIVNARDAMPNGGRITLSTARIALDEMYSARDLNLAAGEYVQIAVSDTGTGMSAEMQRQIFEPFFTTKSEGTGLGLPTVYGIVKQAGGHISVYSEEGVGTTFKVFLPAQPGRRTTSASVVQRSAGTVLIVEDDDAVRALARRTLLNAGLIVLEATEGADALRLAAEHAGAIDVLVTDLMMPHMSGEELATQIRELQPGAGIVLMSGFSERALALNGRISEQYLFLEKPFTPASLTQSVRDAMRAATGGKR